MSIETNRGLTTTILKIKVFGTVYDSCKEDEAIRRIRQYVEYILTHIQALFRFYNFESAPFRFYGYQGRQRANDEMANILMNGGKKYNVAKRRKNNNRNKRRKRKSILRSQGEVQTAIRNHVPRESINKESEFIPSERVPVVVFSDGLKNREQRQLSGTSGVVLNTLYKEMNTTFL